MVSSMGLMPLDGLYAAVDASGPGSSSSLASPVVCLSQTSATHSRSSPKWTVALGVGQPGGQSVWYEKVSSLEQVEQLATVRLPWGRGGVGFGAPGS